ncbi:hypothetical protein ACLB2K_067177 [Fragaria x ananassa]
MVLPMVLLKLADWVWYQLLANSCRRAARKVRNYKPPKHQPPSFPSIAKCEITGGGVIRAFLLLLSCSFLWILDYELQLRVMIFITFCGLKIKNMESVGRAVLPKFYLKNLNLHAYEALASTRSKVVFTSVPRVMVEGFLKEYLEVDDVKGTELLTSGHYFTGLLSKSGLLTKHRALKEHFGDRKPDIGLGTSSHRDNLFISLCKEAYVVNRDDSKSNSSSSSVLPRHRYPKPLIFHDGRLVFLPTPLATLSMFLWIPIGIVLAIFRISVGIFLPYKLALFLATCTGLNLSVKGLDTSTKSDHENKGVLYVCTHRTLLDPVFLSTSLAKPLTAVTYSLSKMSEVTWWCPEGTTCREPYLLRFSSLFAELADEIVPVAVNTKVSMFYGTTASGLKCLDPIFFLMNPRPVYYVEILGKLPKKLTCAGGKSSCEVANYIQRKLGDALGFECTTLTRKDKYLMLAGNEGIVSDSKRKN